MRLWLLRLSHKKCQAFPLYALGTHALTTQSHAVGRRETGGPANSEQQLASPVSEVSHLQVCALALSGHSADAAWSTDKVAAPQAAQIADL